jgi:transposase
MFTQMKDAHVVHMDETPVRVLAPGKGKCDTGQFWVICHDERSWNPDAKPAVFYHYAPSREGRVAEELLSGASSKYLLTDGLAAYNRLFDGERSNDAMAPVRCWAHARRKFYEVSLMSKSKLADRVVKMIRAMYAVKKAAKGLSHEERVAMRQERSLPVLNALHDDLLKHQGQVEGKLKTAINYTLKAFDGLRRFIFDGRLEIDNNPVERCIRGIALTKKNSLCASNHEAAQTWAIYYTLIETARLNQVNPRSYLNWVTSEIERQWGNVDYSQLMP